MSFYESLVRPDWTPPDWAFPAAWFTLWALQAAALAILASAEDGPKGLAFGLLGSQFAAAIAWQAVVFGPGRLLLAAWRLVLVFFLVVATVVVSARVSPLAAALIAPTIVWVSVATALGFELLRLNPNA